MIDKVNVTFCVLDIASKLIMSVHCDATERRLKCIG